MRIQFVFCKVNTFYSLFCNFSTNWVFQATNVPFIICFRASFTSHT